MAGRGGPPGERIALDQNALKAIDDYWEYTRIVGNDDGGTPFTPEEFEKYKREVLPMRMKNRLFVSWTNSNGMDCVLIGPETQCMCQHRYKQHQTDFKELPKSRPILVPCRERGCPCATFTYVPKNGTQPIRCNCKHASDEHRPARPFNCTKPNCKCNGFNSSFTCNCGEPAYAHSMIVETKEEREARGHPTGQDVPYAAMGGITGFSSLADGYMRLDPSGRGRPDDSFFNQPITSNDHPFLRQHAHSDLIRNRDGLLEASPEARSQARRPGESELDFYERRYQERMKAEKTSKPRPIQQNPYDSDAQLQTGYRTNQGQPPPGYRGGQQQPPPGYRGNQPPPQQRRYN